MADVMPTNVVSSPTFVCRPRSCEQITALHCTACGWWGKPNDPDDGGLFPANPEHSADECRRRQTDPDFRHAQDHRRWQDAGVPIGQQ